MGSSPLTRGKREFGELQVEQRGLIPAHAGKTHAVGSGPPTRAAHPRSRGENHHLGVVPVIPSGSSPLTRGKLIVQEEDTMHFRLIPAHAGKTMTAMDARDWSGAHPRSRGENGELAATKHTLTGSSPLTRGKPGGGRELSVTARLIPAHAGKTRRKQRRGERQAAHPRSRGENLSWLGDEAPGVGSSPLTRGKPSPSPSEMTRTGLIPAHAGKTLLGLRRCSATWAHPRSRGENDQRAAARRDCGGSSPLTRGKLYEQGCEWADKRLIPAHAGKTRRAHDARRLRKAHPRSRGENP